MPIPILATASAIAWLGLLFIIEISILMIADLRETGVRKSAQRAWLLAELRRHHQLPADASWNDFRSALGPKFKKMRKHFNHRVDAPSQAYEELPLHDDEQLLDALTPIIGKKNQIRIIRDGAETLARHTKRIDCHTTDFYPSAAVPTNPVGAIFAVFESLEQRAPKPSIRALIADPEILKGAGMAGLTYLDAVGRGVTASLLLLMTIASMGLIGFTSLIDLATPFAAAGAAVGAGCLLARFLGRVTRSQRRLGIGFTIFMLVTIAGSAAMALARATP